MDMRLECSHVFEPNIHSIFLHNNRWSVPLKDCTLAEPRLIESRSMFHNVTEFGRILLDIRTLEPDGP